MSDQIQETNQDSELVHAGGLEVDNYTNTSPGSPSDSNNQRLLADVEDLRNKRAIYVESKDPANSTVAYLLLRTN